MINKDNHYDDNFSILREDEKQEIYLTYHDELPWNLEKCCVGDEYLNRPEHTKPCGEAFYVKEEEIFTNSNDGNFYQVCPHCGYIVNIPGDVLSDGIKKRILDRCIKDPYLFRKMYLYSELFSLDKSSSKEQKRMLKII